MSKQCISTSTSDLRSRARDLLERAERTQALHAQTQAEALARRAGATPAAPGQADAVQLLSHSASQAIHDMHLALQEAAQQAHRLAQADPEIARLNARINGTEPNAPPEVIDVDGTEVAGDGSGDQTRIFPPLPPTAPDSGS